MKTAYIADRVFDGETVLTNRAVVVERKTVTGIVPVDSLPADTKRVVEPSATILPGLTDAHIHFMRWEGPLFLAHGVTSVRDTGNRLDWILQRRTEWPDRPWPRIWCLGPILDGPQPAHPLVSVACPDAAAAVAAVQDTAAAGVDGIKLYVCLEKEWLPAMAARCHEAGLKVSMHCLGTGVQPALQAGVDEFYHLDGVVADVWPNPPRGWLSVWGLPEFAATFDRQQQLADRIRESGITATPTLAYWDSQWRVRRPGYPLAGEAEHVPSRVIDWQGSDGPDPAGSAQWRRALEAAQKFTGLLLERKVPVLAGTDVPCGAVPAGLSLWRELSLLCEAGMSPIQALRSATTDVGAYLNDPNLGRLKPGSPADLVVVGGNPTDKIPEQPDVRLVVRAGTEFRPEELLEAAQRDAATVEDDPWSAQFEMHRRRR